jgi:hypothetical protein
MYALNLKNICQDHTFVSEQIRMPTTPEDNC